MVDLKVVGEWGGRTYHKPVLGQMAAKGESRNTKIKTSTQSLWKKETTAVSMFHFLNAKWSRLCWHEAVFTKLSNKFWCCTGTWCIHSFKNNNKKKPTKTNQMVDLASALSPTGLLFFFQSNHGLRHQHLLYLNDICTPKPHECTFNSLNPFQTFYFSKRNTMELGRRPPPIQKSF